MDSLHLGSRVKVCIRYVLEWNAPTAAVLDGLTGTVVAEVRPQKYLVKFDPHERGALPRARHGSNSVAEFHFEASDLEVLP